jgi:predicted amidophosphoribosyltransferase
MNKLKWLDENCHVCEKQLNSWDKRCSKALKYKNTVCEQCICKEYDKDIEDFRATMNHFFGLIPCMGI